MSQPLVQGGRALLRFRLLGFPVHIDVSFLIVVGLLGYYPGVTATRWVLWIVIAPLAVLVHELGHALVARTTGASPSITLAGLGGLTSYVPPRPVSRGRSIGISLAGPAVGLLIGAALVLLGRAVQLQPGTPLAAAYDAAVFTTIGWSVLNLLPVLPLDGGQALRELLPGEPWLRERRAAAVSVVVGVAVALLAWRASYTFGAVLAAFFVVNNVLTLRQPRPTPPSPEAAIAALLWAGRRDEARHRLDAEPGEVDPAVRGAVLAVTSEHEAGLAMLREQDARRPGDADVAALTALALTLLHDWDAVLSLVTGPRSQAVAPVVVLRAQEEAFAAGAFTESARIAEAFLDRHTGAGVEDGTTAVLAYNAACGWARAGALEQGMAAFDRAASLGFDDLARVDTDEDLAPLRGRPGYLPAREVVRRTALDREAQRPAGA